MTHKHFCCPAVNSLGSRYVRLPKSSAYCEHTRAALTENSGADAAQPAQPRASRRRMRLRVRKGWMSEALSIPPMLPLGEQWRPRGGSRSCHPMRAVREGERDAGGMPVRGRAWEAARCWLAVRDAMLAYCMYVVVRRGPGRTPHLTPTHSTGGTTHTP